MKVLQVYTGHSFKCKTRPGIDKNFDMTEFSCSRTIEIDPGEDVNKVIRIGLMACRKNVLEACQASGLAYATGVGTKGQDRVTDSSDYVQIGGENQYMKDVMESMKPVGEPHAPKP